MSVLPKTGRGHRGRGALRAALPNWEGLTNWEVDPSGKGVGNGGVLDRNG